MEKNPEFLNAFQSIGSCFASNQVVEKEIEKFVCLMYQQKEVDDVNVARYNIFQLGKYLDPIVNAPYIAKHGWLVDNDGNVSIDWMDLPPAPDGILENVQCACKTGCMLNKCSCRKANLRCTSVCRCNQCSNGALENEDGDESDNVPENVDTTDTDESDGEYGD